MLFWTLSICDIRFISPWRCFNACITVADVLETGFQKEQTVIPKKDFCVFFCTFEPGTLCSEFIQQAKMLPSFVVHRIPAGHGQQQKRQHLQGLRFCKENVPQCSTHVQCNHLFDNSHKGLPLLKLCRKAVNIYIYMQGKSNNHDERHSLFSDANILFKHALLPD